MQGRDPRYPLDLARNLLHFFFSPGDGRHIGARFGAGPRDAFALALAERLRAPVRRARTMVEVVVLATGWLLGGTVVIETVFGIPGMGRLVVYSILNRDYPVVQGVILYMAIIYMLVNLLVDFIVTLMNPRIRY